MIARRALVAASVLLAATAVHAATSAAEIAVGIDNFTFSPASVSVAVGTRIVWTNHDDIPHTVTAADDPRHTRSPALDTGESYARVFDKPGVWHYFCSLHPHMQGTVRVR